MYEILDQIHQYNDIKKISQYDYQQLAAEIRLFLIRNISRTGGHLASNLGVVELSMALHLFLDFPEDKLVWDVGHQSYTHKLLTGRKEDFATLRQYEGMSGFPKRKESICDCFDTGHSSTSISAADGLVKARVLRGSRERVVAVIGDGALSGGLAYEALNHAGRFKTNLIIILNDNNMSISENVGGMATYLGKIRTNSKYTGFKWELEDILKRIPFGVGEDLVQTLKRSKDSIKHLLVPGMFFENMGITYIGPIDGHNIEHIQTALYAASKSKVPVLVHVVTQKGRGYKRAEKDPSRYHGVDPFDYRTGKALNKKSGLSYTEVFSRAMLRIAEDEPSMVAICAAMADGTGLNRFRENYPKRFFDVGIAEEHAVTFAAGLAVGGFRPVVAIYSTFLQRAYDQIVHDVCVGGLPVIFAIDRAGIVGNDGETHQGIFDLSFLSHIPGLAVMAPKNANEFTAMLRFALTRNGPSAIRYPRGKAYQGLRDKNEPIILGKSEVLFEDKAELVLLAVGSMVETAVILREKLIEAGHKCDLINARFVSPIDEACLHWIGTAYKKVVTMEENIKSGGFGERVSAFFFEHGYIGIGQLNISLPNDFLAHGNQELLRHELGLDAESILQRMIDKWRMDQCL